MPTSRGKSRSSPTISRWRQQLGCAVQVVPPYPTPPTPAPMVLYGHTMVTSHAIGVHWPFSHLLTLLFSHFSLLPSSTFLPQVSGSSMASCMALVTNKKYPYAQRACLACPRARR